MWSVRDQRGDSTHSIRYCPGWVSMCSSDSLSYCSVSKFPLFVVGAAVWAAVQQHFYFRAMADMCPIFLYFCHVSHQTIKMASKPFFSSGVHGKLLQFVFEDL